MSKMWSTVCAVAIMTLGAHCASQLPRAARSVATVTPVTPASAPVPPAPVVTYHPPIDPLVLQDVFGTPNTLLATGAASETVEEPSLDSFRPSFNLYDDFDWSLTKRMASATDKNLLLSPFGLKLALAILTEAATGVTAAELQFVLGLDTNATRVHAKFADILGSLHTKSSQYILDLGSRIYVDAGADPRQKFAATAEQHYRTEVLRADLQKHPAAAVADINSWISNLTHGRIPDLVTEGDLDDAVMLVVNTLFFKGTWRYQFPPNETRLDNFYTSSSKVVQVPFMNLENDLFYAESTKMEAKILRLPYLGNKFSMYLIVPNSIGGLPRVLQEITGHHLRQEMWYLAPRRVRVRLPRFQYEFSSQLKTVLQELGIKQAFSHSASFPGIARGETLDQGVRISHVLQKSGIELNELGSLLYSATVVAVVNKFGEDDESTVEVNVNKPFLFFVEDEKTRQLLFTGRVTNPAESAGAFH